MNFYKHYIGDYARSTGHLSVTEHGAYRLLLDHFYGAGRPLPANRRNLYRLVRAETEYEKRAVDTIVERFWLILPESLPEIYSLLELATAEDQERYCRLAAGWEERGLINLRALQEILAAATQAEKNRQIAINREAKKRQQAQQGGAE